MIVAELQIGTMTFKKNYITPITSVEQGLQAEASKPVIVPAEQLLKQQQIGKNTVDSVSWQPGQYVVLNVTAKDHSKHDVIENMALNKTFKYCRDCKEEV